MRFTAPSYSAESKDSGYHQISYQPGKKQAVFRHFGVSSRTGYRMLSTNPRRINNDPFRRESRGRKSIITEEQLRSMEKIIENHGFDGRTLTWAQLGYEAGVSASWLTVKRVLGSLDYRKCTACKKGWQSPSNAKRRVEWAKKML